MSAYESHINEIFNLIPEKIKQTTVLKKIHGTLVELVDPEKVAELVKTLINMGIRQVNYAHGLRTLNPELAKRIAIVARDTLVFTVNELETNNIHLTKAINRGSATLGLIGPESDIDITLFLPTKHELDSAGDFLRSDKEFQNRLWKVSKTRVSKISYLLTAMNMYDENPGEKWIPEAHDSITLPFPKK